MKNLLWLFLPLFLAFFIFFTGCQSQYKKEDEFIQSLIQEGQRLHKQKQLLHWFLTIEGRPFRYAEFYTEHQWLLTATNLQRMERHIARTENQNRLRELQYFKNFLLQEMIQFQLAPTLDSLLELELVPLPAKQKPARHLQELPAILNNLSDKRAYQALLQDARPLLQKWFLLYRHQLLKTDRLAQQMGMSGFLELEAVTHNYSYHQVATLAKNLLERSDSLYQQLLVKAGTETIFSQQSLNLRHLLGAPQKGIAENIFSSEKLYLAEQALFEALQIQSTAISHLTLNLNEQKNKLFVSFCAPIAVPTDIRISLRPQNSFPDYLHLYYLTGKALHYLHTRQKSGIFQALGNAVVPELSGCLMQNLWSDSTWLRNWALLPESDLRALQDYLNWQQVADLRLQAGLLLHLNALLEDKTVTISRLSTQLSEILKINLSDEETLLLLLAHRSGANPGIALQGKLLALLVENRGRNQGRPWYQNGGHLQKIKSIWSGGMRWMTRELLQEFGAEELTPEILLENYATRLSSNQ